jgi:hypothetical protein
MNTRDIAKPASGRSGIGTTLAAAGAALGVAAASYAAYIGAAWWRYGHPVPPSPEETDGFLDGLMPEYEVVERHHTPVNAPADAAFAAAVKMDLQDSLFVRAIFKARELALGSQQTPQPSPGGLVETTKSLGWRVMVEIPGREIVMGAVTQPWKPNPVFRAIPPEQFAAFAEPDYVKILWTMRADPVGAARSIVRTETRVATTDVHARSAFRAYWACVSPGVALIRHISMRLIRKNAEAAYLGSGSSSVMIVPPSGGASM